MLNELRKISIFIKRDFRMLFTYKLAFTVSLLSIIFNLFYLLLFGSMFGSRDVGSVGWSFLTNIMNSTAFSLRTEMMMGTLESILITPTKIHTVIFGYVLFGCFFGLLSMGVLIVVGIFCFGVTAFATANIFTLIIFILSTIMMMGFGMIFSGLTIWLKNIGDTIPIILGVSMFFCGIYFPIQVLPEFLQPVAKFIPFYYSIEGIRKSLIINTSTHELMGYIVILSVLAITFIALGIFILHKGLIKAKKDGSLAFY